MFKKLLLILTFSLITHSAFAVCGAIPLPILDGTGASRNISSKSAADGNCETLIDIDTSSQLHTDITAATPAGTNNIGKIDILGNAGATLDGPAGTAATQALTVQGVAGMTKLLVTPDSVALPANQSVNVAQFGGTSTSTGQVAVSTAPVTATNTALVVDLRPDSPGIIALGQTTKSASVPVTIASDQYVDPCQSPNVAKSSVPINLTAAAGTTSLVAVSGATVVYVCGISFTIAPSATTADSILFEYGTGAACTSPVALTGTFGSGDVTTSAPLVTVNYGGAGSTIFKSAASNGICALTAGSVINIQGVMTYVQQ